MAVKFKDFLQIWLGANHDVDKLDVYVSNPYDESEIYNLKCSLRNYLLFGDYYITTMEIDYLIDKVSRPYLSIIISKNVPDPLEECLFAYE